MKPLSILFLVMTALPGGYTIAQSKKDMKTAAALQEEISYLASDDLQGRRTGTEGEQKAAAFIESFYRQQGIPAYKGHYRFPFRFVHGKEISPESSVSFAGAALKINDEYFPLPFSNCGQVTGELLPDVMENGNLWLVNIYADQAEADDPHFDWERSMYKRSKEAAEQGASAVLFYDGYGAKNPPFFNGMSEFEKVKIPSAVITNSAYRKYIATRDSTAGSVKLVVNLAINKAERTGINIAAIIDNRSRYTVVLGAHYDHLGFGEDGNSLYTSKEKMVHHGADDNASGTAALLHTAKWIKRNKLRHYNYLFINFSGEELGLLGSKAFVKDTGMDSAHVAYMINMDMVGRLNDSTHALYIGGVGTSPAWGKVLTAPKGFKYVIDSSGIGPSDHSSFYHVGIPALFFFTGTHMDYHKPADVAEKINYSGEVAVIKQVCNVVKTMERLPKPTFTPTKQNATGRVSLKVTLGIIPDYSYTDEGLRVDGVSEDRPAKAAGVQEGDIITRLGSYDIQGMSGYMEALGKFAPGDTTTVVVKRKDMIVKLPVKFTKK